MYNCICAFSFQWFVSEECWVSVFQPVVLTLNSTQIDEKWVKAFVFKGRALQKMKRFDEAIQTFKAILVVDGKKSKMVEGAGFDFIYFDKYHVFRNVTATSSITVTLPA